MNTHDYTYCFLRYRQDPEAGEFANIGLALWSPTLRFLAFQGSKRYSRLTHFFGDLDRDGYRLLIAHVERRFDALSAQLQQELALEAYPDNVRELACNVVPQDDGSLIWGPPRGGFTADPNSELSRLFDRFIGRHNEGVERARRDEDQIFREVYRKAFTNERVAPRLQEHEIVAPLAQHTFKYAWKNGVWNVYETLSFDLLEAESIEKKAHAWFGRSVHLAQSADEPRLHYLLGKPSISANSQAYIQAKNILESAPNVLIVEEEQANEFARDLESAVAADC
jgi:AcrR family transcriptional regulator